MPKHVSSTAHSCTKKDLLKDLQDNLLNHYMAIASLSMLGKGGQKITNEINY